MTIYEALIVMLTFVGTLFLIISIIVDLLLKIIEVSINEKK